MNQLIFIAVLAVITSCKSQKEVVQHTDKTDSSRDSIVYIDKVVVDTIRIPSETLEIQVPVEVLKTDTVMVYKNGRASTKVVYRDGVLNLNTRCDSLEKLVLSTEKILIKERQRNTQLTEKNQSREVMVRPVRWYYKAAFWVVMALVAFWLCKTALKAYNGRSLTRIFGNK